MDWLYSCCGGSSPGMEGSVLMEQSSGQERRLAMGA